VTLFDAFLHLANPATFGIVVVGVLLGLCVGVLPGITGGMLMALTLPFTYYMGSQDAVILLVSQFVGGISGGLVTATLMRIPGEPNAVMTCLDGYPLAKKGFPGRALGLGNSASIVGGALSWCALVLLAPPLASLALALGPWEEFAIVCVALVLIAALSSGSLVKGLMSALFGMIVALPGIDPTSGTLRLTFGSEQLSGGINLLPAVIGFFAISQILADTLNIEGQSNEHVRANLRGILISVRDYARYGVNMLRSSLIGITMGILPGVGSTIASIVAYTTAKNVSAHPEQFGHGSEEAIVATESANNATSGGTLIPLLTLGIPGGLADSVLLGALILHNLQPGPLLYTHHPEIVNAIMATHLVAHFVMFALMTLGVALFARMMLISSAWIFPLVLVFCIVGAYSLSNQMFDVGVMMVFALVGLGFEFAKVPLAPFVVGFVLAPLAEGKLRSSLMSSDGDIWAVKDHPVAMALLGVAVAMLFLPPLRRRLMERRLLRLAQERPAA
jgi:putative tricarboxylic transport membrane protein